MERKDFKDLEEKLAHRRAEYAASVDKSASEGFRCSYSNLSEKFKLYQKEDFSKQFYHIYAVRLEKMRETCLKRVQQKWGKDVCVLRLAEMKDEEQLKCVVIGTLFKHQELKPSILKEISEEHNLLPQPARTNFVDDSDKLILEDELQRIQLIGEFNVHEAVTGVVCAVLGTPDSSGKFQVEDFCWAGPAACGSPRQLDFEGDRFVVLVSGLGVVDEDSTFSINLLIECLAGVVPNKYSGKIARVIIAGNSVRSTTQLKAGTVNSQEILPALQEFDRIVHKISKCAFVDVMSGEFDITNHLLPQQPMHFCLFKEALRLKTFQCVTNPYDCEVGGRRLLGTSGQPVDDVARYSTLEDPLQILEQTLRWGHVSPTSPDTLSCFPFYKEDPFIICDCPDVYFAGNQPKFQTKMYEDNQQKVRLVCIPSFSKTQECVFVNLRTLECETLKFLVG
ncbi:DNA polymerase delta subunit 2 [Bacillus rossius redtenbacheri]|uniref:DNA polymerase delta subunit 2 n=1 Tax=Bacillus rossius redtenbacheri TaxID=93214 RepID=UPI002FDEECD9